MKKHEFIKAIHNVCAKYHKSGGDLAGIGVGYEGITIEFTNKSKRAGWVEDMLFCLNDDFPNYHILVNDKKRRIVVIELVDEDGAVFGTGVALCSKNDTFNSEVGLAVAYANAVGEDIPDYV